MENEWTREIERLRALNAEMLTALKYWFDSKAEPAKLAAMARAAIDKAEQA